MTPAPRTTDPRLSSAGGGAPAATAGTAALTQLLGDGEVVLLAFRPSGWFVLLVSWPVLAAALVISLAALAAGTYLNLEAPRHLLLVLCSAGAALRIIIACIQWMGRLYVLTNYRIMRVRGVLRVDAFQCPLRRIRGTVLTATFTERMLGLGSLFFEVADEQPAAAAWTYISRPAEIQETVNQAIRRSQ